VSIFELDSVAVVLTNPFAVEGTFQIKLAITYQAVSAETVVTNALKGTFLYMHKQ
jgi:hypothetical protein